MDFFFFFFFFFLIWGVLGIARFGKGKGVPPKHNLHEIESRVWIPNADNAEVEAHD